MKINIYIAASFSFPNREESDAHKAVINEAAKILRRRNYNVFVPHEHILPNAWGMTNDEWGHAVFGIDMTGLDTADIVLVISWGKNVTNGGCFWEAGYAAAKNIPIILLSMTTNVESLMVTSSAIAHLNNINQLFSYDIDNLPALCVANNEVN